MAKYNCTRCKKEFVSNEIKLTTDGKVVCLGCLGQKPKLPEAKKEVKEEYVEYVCMNCDYSFKRRKSLKIEVCPYCSKKDKIILKKSQNADNLLKESIDRKYEL